jgi:hypothetical protein
MIIDNMVWWSFGSVEAIEAILGHKNKGLNFDLGVT